MKRNLAMSAAMFDIYNGSTFYATTYLMSGAANLDVLKDTKYLLNGIFYHTNTLITDLLALGNKVLAKYTKVQATDNPIGTVNIAGSSAITVTNNGEATWFITLLRESSADLTSPGYAYVVMCGLVGDDDSSDMIVANPNMQLNSVLTITGRKVRIVGHEQST